MSKPFDLSKPYFVYRIADPLQKPIEIFELLSAKADPPWSLVYRLKPSNTSDKDFIVRFSLNGTSQDNTYRFSNYGPIKKWKWIWKTSYDQLRVTSMHYASAKEVEEFLLPGEQIIGRLLESEIET